MDTNDIDRRTVLRRVTTASLAASLTATTASADRAESTGVRDQLAAVGVTDDPFDAGDLPRRQPGELTDGGEGVTRIETSDGSRLLVDDGVTDLSTTGTCDDECSASNCYYDSGQVVLEYDLNSDGYCVATDYDCGCS